MNRGHLFVLAKQSLGFSQGIVVGVAIISATVVVDQLANPFVADTIYNSLGI